MPPNLDIAAARAQDVGARLRVAGIVTAEAGRLGLPPVFAIGDASGGIAVRISDGIVPPARGTAVVLDGVLAAPYGQLELRLVAGGLVVVGPAHVPDAVPIGAAELGEGLEGRLVTIVGTLQGRATRSSSGDLSVEATDLAGMTFRILVDASSGLTVADFSAGQAYHLVGIAGQRASRKGALDGYRIWLRDRDDLEAIVAGTASPSATSPRATSIPISDAIRREGDSVTVEGAVTAGQGLLDVAGRRIVVADPSGAIEVVLPSGMNVRVGDRIRVSGEVGRAWGAPRIAAELVEPGFGGSAVLPLVLDGPPGPAHEWRLVRVSGRVVDVRRLGSTWRAELHVRGERVLIAGLAGAGIASTALVEGRPATIIGIVRRPYPSATDRRFQVIPRGPSDVALGPASGTTDGPDGRPASGSSTRPPHAGDATTAPTDVDLATLAEHVGELVRVGGLVVEPTADGFTLDDATAIATVVLRGEAAAYLGLLEPGDALNAIGVVERRGDGFVVAVDAPSGLIRVGDLGQEILLTAPEEAATTSSEVPTSKVADAAWPGAHFPAVGLLGVLIASLLSLGLTLVRRRRMAFRAALVARERLSELGRDDRSA